MSPAAPLTSQNYIGWVQRSLNRILRQSEVTDGTDRLIYRDMIGMFQQMPPGYPVTREIHPADQDRIIKFNHANVDYMRWVRATVRNLGVIELADKDAIGAFQQSVGLGKDGWVGAKTETALIANSGSFPPGHIVVPKAKPKPPPPPGLMSMLDRLLLTDDASARMIAPATIEPFPNTVALPQ